MKRTGFSAVAGLLLFALVATSGAAMGETAPILIKDTGSTNGIGFQFTIYRHRPAVCVYDDWAKHRQITSRFPHKLGPPDGKSVIPAALVSQFFQDVASQMPLSKLKHGHCLKSASFGSSTYIVYKEEESPDIQCLTKGSRRLYKDYTAILRSLRER